MNEGTGSPFTQLLETVDEVPVPSFTRDGINYRLISLYEELYRKVSRDKEYQYLIEVTKKNIITYLVRYGSYLKTEYRKDDIAAESTLKKAIKYERAIPLAHYRLGFLAYKRKSFLEALLHFQNAQSKTNDNTIPEFRLNNQQAYHAQIYIANSSLYIAKQAQEKAHKLEEETNVETVSTEQLSPLQLSIQILKVSIVSFSSTSYSSLNT